MYEDKVSREKRIADQRARRFTVAVDSKPQPRYGLKQFTAQYDAEQAEIAQRPIRKAQAEIKAIEDETIQTLRELNANVRDYWSQPLNVRLATSDRAVVDTIGEYESGVPVTRVEAKQVQNDFFEGLAGNDVTLTYDASVTLGGFFQTLVTRRRVAYTLANLAEALHRLVDLGVFVEGHDVTGFAKYARKPVPKPAPVVAPTPKPSIENLRIEHREENQQIRQIIGDEWSDEFAKIFILWTKSLRDKWGYVFPVNELGPKVAEYIKKHKLNTVARPTYDRIRVVFSRLGLFRNSAGQVLDLRLPDEVLADQIEESDLSDYRVRQDLNYRAQELRRN
jgi:hypothetical protein